MAVYIFVSILSVSSAAAAVKIKSRLGREKIYYLFCILSYLPLALLSALRFRTGTDWWIYDLFFRSINKGGERFSEEGFNLLNRLVYLFSRDVSALTAITALITCLFIFIGIFGQSDNAALSILIYIINADYFTSYNQLRQALAAAIFLYAIKFIRERKVLPYLAWIVAASTIHFGAIFLLPLYLLYGIRLNFKLHIAALIVAAISLPLTGKLFVFIVQMTRYSWYIDSYYDTGNFYLSGFLFSLCLLFLYNIYHFYAKDNPNAEYCFFANICLLSSLMLMYTAFVPQILRLSTMFGIVNCFGIPMLVSMERKPARRALLFLFLISLFIIKLLYDVYVNGWYDVIPYHSIFSGKWVSVSGYNG